MKKVVIIFLIVLLTNCFVNAEEQYPIDKLEEESIQNDWTTSGMVNATVKATGMWEKEMNKYYGLLKKELDSPEREQLTRSQQAWLKFYNEEIKNISNVFGQLTGTMYIPMCAANVRELVKTRALDLKHYYDLIIDNK